jgi:glutamate synthase domain-containing protein 2
MKIPIHLHATVLPVSCTTLKWITLPLTKADFEDKMMSEDINVKDGLRESATFDRTTMTEIRRAAETGIYDIRGFGAKRKLPHFDDLLFLGASMSRYPLEGYREKCNTSVTLGTRYAKKPIELDIPVTIAGMSFGALSANAKEALGRGASLMGTSTTTGDGGMTPEERGQSSKLVYQYLPSRYGMNPDDLRKADAIEVVLGQGAKPGGGGMLLGQKITDRVAQMRTLPMGVDQRSACRHPDWTGPDDLAIKIQELREITDWQVPIYIKVGATRTYYDVKLAVKAGADVIVVDGMQGGTAATQDVFIEHVGIPTLAAIPQAVRALQEMGMHRKVQLIVSGGIRNGADVAKCMALGADAVAIGTAALVALGCNHPMYDEEFKKIGSAAGFYDDYHEGKDPAGISTQDPDLMKRLDPVDGGRRLANYLNVLILEAQTLARACGKNDLRNLEPEDLVALTVESAAMANVPLAGTTWIPGKGY